jgi:hypothetical protein
VLIKFAEPSEICSHMICIPCFQQAAEVKIIDRNFVMAKGMYTMGCPMGCGAEGTEIDEAHYFKMMTRELYERYQDFGTQAMVLEMGGAICPFAGCNGAILPEDIIQRQSRKRATCASCNKIHCTRCNSEWHEGDCSEAALVRQQAAIIGQPVDPEIQRRALKAAELLAMISDESAKPCPNCQALVDKFGGCNHMTCTACQYECCWACLPANKSWPGACQGAHWF